MSAGRRLLKAWGWVLNHTLNPLTRRLGRAGVGPIALVRHIGRRSGKPYETPIIVAPLGPDLVIELTYGDRVDWYRNFQAAGGGSVLWHRRVYTIDRLDPLPAATGRGAFPAPARVVLWLLNRQHYVLLHVASVRPI